MNLPEGLIAKIQPLSVCNGPGIRTVIFMKGCTLRCLKCVCPHMQKNVGEILFTDWKCSRCLICKDICPRDAIMEDSACMLKIDDALCDKCGICAECCPYGALELLGRYYSICDLMQEIEKGVPTYQLSSGGVTITGGEPAMQAEFVSAFLQQCRRHEIHTVLETQGFASWQKIAMITEWPDLIYFNIRHMNDEAHRRLTGYSNRLILENLRKVAERHSVTIRIPIIPHMNDTEENATELAQFACRLGKNVNGIEIIRYHENDDVKKQKLDRKYENLEIAYRDDGKIIALKTLLEYYGLNVRIESWKGG